MVMMLLLLLLRLLLLLLLLHTQTLHGGWFMATAETQLSKLVLASRSSSNFAIVQHASSSLINDATFWEAFKARCARSGNCGHWASACHGNTNQGQPVVKAVFIRLSSVLKRSMLILPWVSWSSRWGVEQLALAARKKAVQWPPPTEQYFSLPVSGLSMPWLVSKSR